MTHNTHSQTTPIHLPTAGPRRALKAARVARGWTQEQLAAALGVAQQTVAKWEQGRSTPQRLGQMRAVAQFLGTEPALIFPDVLPPSARLLDEGRCRTCQCWTPQPQHPPRTMPRS